MQCDLCAAPIGPNARYCEQCGAPVGASASAGSAGSAGLHPADAGDRRIVTALFADIVDYVRMVADLDPEVVQARVTRALGAMAEAVERLGGTREKFIGDAIYAVFGWPVARDDDPVRAALCALSIRGALSEVDGGEPLEVRIGIATGEVASMRPSGPLEDSRLTGPAIVTAARLQSLARPGEILVDEATVRAARNRLGVTDRGSVILRGHAGSVHVYAVERESVFETWDPPRRPADSQLVGRADELDVLHDVLTTCRREGRGGAVLIEGEAGIGKSRLLLEAERLARESGLAWTWTENVSYGGGEPYRFARVLAQAFADEHGTDSGSFTRQMLFTPDVDPATARRYGGAIAAIAREAEFTGWEAEAADMPDDPAEVARSLQDVAERYIDRVIETAGPRAIVVDDLHWIDHSSAPMLELLVQRTTQLPLVIFGAMRPGPAPSWAAAGHVRRIRLAGLRELESGQLATIVARAALNAADARHIHERTGGNPLFVTETVRASLADGTLAVQDGLLTLIDGAGASLPVTLRSVLGARIDALSAAAREVLGVASVIGMRFRTPMVGAVVGEPLSPEIVQELAQSALISPIDQELWRFGHALIRDAAYSGLLASTRRQLHARVADELERDEPAPPVAWIARHRAAAGDRERGLPLLDEAAQEALAIGAGREAAAFWREAAELAGDPEDAMRFLHQASEAARAAVAVDPRLG